MASMPQSVKKSSAPLFVTFDASPNYDDPSTFPCTAEEIAGTLSFVPCYEGFWGFEKGEIVCELVPLGFVYKKEDGSLVEEDVNPEDLVALLHMQGEIADGKISME